MKWMLQVFFATTVVWADGNISDSKIYCDAGVAIGGQAARITCYFHRDLQAARRSVTVVHYRSSALDDIGTDVLVCNWSQGSKDACIATEGYGYESSTNDTVTLTIANVTTTMAGVYDCNLAADTSNRLPCNLTFIEKPVEKSAESSKDSPINSGLIIGVSVGAAAVLAIIIIVAYLCRRYLRRQRLQAGRPEHMKRKHRDCIINLESHAPSATNEPADKISLKTDPLVSKKTEADSGEEVPSPTTNSATPLLSNTPTGLNTSAEKPEEPETFQYLATIKERDSHGPSDVTGEPKQCVDNEGKLYGNQPEDGKMTMTYSTDPLLGFEDTGSFEIRYIFPTGKQSACHPHPGKGYAKTDRVAYLPDTPEGRKVLMLLKVAFDRRLTFTIGFSKTSGSKYEGIVWNGIPHKTNRTGGRKSYAYPDETYLDYVQSALREKKVTESDLTDVQLSFVRTPNRKMIYNDSPSDFSHLFNTDA